MINSVGKMFLLISPPQNFSFPLASQQSRRRFCGMLCASTAIFTEIPACENHSPSLNLIIIYYSFLVYKATVSCRENLFAVREHGANPLE